MLAAILLLTSLGSPVDLVALERGSIISGKRYVAVEDTSLDLGRPDEPQGGNSILQSGGGKAILIQFRELRATLGWRKVRSARLEFTISGGKPELGSVKRMLLPWSEGPINSISSQIRGDTTGGRWAATQRNRRAGNEPIAWQAPGARGDLDAEAVPGATGTLDGVRFVISGLEAAVQAQLDRPTLNHGFRIEFVENVDFLSSDSTEGRPRLVLELENAERPKGADLSVILIERTPEYERYDTLGQSQVADQDGVAVPAAFNVANPDAKRWPDDGEEVTYRATVKNVGDAAAGPFEAQWLIREAPSGLTSVERSLEPGETAVIELKTPFRSSHTDHRLQPIALRLFPKGTDADRANDELEVQQAALALGFVVTEAAATRFAAEGIAWEDAIQRAVHRWNEVLSRYSRFSFAPAGSLERVRTQRLARGSTFEVDLHLDGQIVVDTDTDLMAAIARACGLVELTPPGLRAGSVAAGDVRIPPSPDRYPNILGGGETRSDALLAPTFAFPHERFIDPIADPERYPVSAGLSASDVYALNRNLGRRRGFSGDYLYDVPGSVLVTLTDPAGKRLANQEVTIYAMRNGSFAGAVALNTLRTGETGSILLPKRDAGVPAGSYTPTGHQLSANPFGRVDASGLNGAIALRAVVHGVESVAVVKLWQILDAVARSRQPLAMLSVALQVPNVPLAAAAFAVPNGAAKSDSGTVLDSITDSDPATEAPLPATWIEIDLGKEIAMGKVEVTLRTDGTPVGGYDLMVYRQGEKPEIARLFAREGDIGWSLLTRGHDSAPGTKVLRYYGLPQRARFIRLVPRLGASGFKLVDVTCTPAR